MAGQYEGATFLLTTKHAKSLAIGPAIWRHLGASVLEHVADTDQLGTFSGEVAREGSALDCARRKCEWGLETSGPKAEYGLASEGSFGPHPAVPFMAGALEILYFIDKHRHFHLHVDRFSEATNYQMARIASWEELLAFAKNAGFPSHALILRPDGRERHDVMFKGVVAEGTLREAFETCRKAALTPNLWVETDMRAHLNPTRRSVIAELAETMAQRLATPCPSCAAPGWGRKRTLAGLPCADCGTPTTMVAQEIWSCVLCPYSQAVPRSDGLTEALPMQCPCCNP